LRKEIRVRSCGEALGGEKRSRGRPCGSGGRSINMRGRKMVVADYLKKSEKKKIRKESDVKRG